MRAYQHFADFFLPRFCFGCENKLHSGSSILCDKCMGSLIRAESKRINAEFDRKFRDRNIISELISVFVFEKDKPIQNLFHNLKYNKRYVIGKYFADLITDQVIAGITNWEAQLMIPIPLHKIKRRERGFNQSEYIAKGISARMGLTLRTNILYRKKFTDTQTTLTIKEREQNVKGAFEIRNSGLIKERSIVLVDDIITTGATMNEAGRVLLKGGAGKIFALSAAIAD